MKLENLADDALELIFNKIVRFIQFDWENKNIFALVNMMFYNECKSRILSMMSTPFDFKTQIAYFIGNHDEDYIDYLIGVSKIESNYTIEKAQKELNLPTEGFDNYNSLRGYSAVILSSIYPGDNFGPKITGMDVEYESKVKYRKTNENITIEEKIDEKYSNRFKCNNESYIYWIYVLEELCHYCKTYSYVILPYLDNKIAIYNHSRVHTIYPIKRGVDFVLEDDFQ